MKQMPLTKMQTLSVKRSKAGPSWRNFLYEWQPHCCSSCAAIISRTVHHEKIEAFLNTICLKSAQNPKKQVQTRIKNTNTIVQPTLKWKLTCWNPASKNSRPDKAG
jgi:hypothetical protein